MSAKRKPTIPQNEYSQGSQQYLKYRSCCLTISLFVVENRIVTTQATSLPGSFLHFDRSQWDALVDRTPLPLTDADIEQIAGFGDPIDMREVDAIYRPLSALLQLYVDGRRRVLKERCEFQVGS